ncbi:hypothetical protein L7F22_046585 [Adiantum nelumboides]|nr:hypothetical protein [Adiantum nelumboides]
MHSRLLHHFVREEGHCHDSPHLPPVISIDCENHVLPLTGENVEDDIAGAGAKFNTLGVQNLLGKLRGGDYHEIALSHLKEEDLAVFLCQLRQIFMVEVVTDLEPVTKEGYREGAWWEAEIGLEDVGDGEADEDEAQQGEKDGLKDGGNGEGQADEGQQVRHRWLCVVCARVCVFGECVRGLDGGVK